MRRRNTCFSERSTLPKRLSDVVDVRDRDNVYLGLLVNPILHDLVVGILSGSGGGHDIYIAPPLAPDKIADAPLLGHGYFEFDETSEATGGCPRTHCPQGVAMKDVGLGLMLYGHMALAAAYITGSYQGDYDSKPCICSPNNPAWYGGRVPPEVAAYMQAIVKPPRAKSERFKESEWERVGRLRNARKKEVPKQLSDEDRLYQEWLYKTATTKLPYVSHIDHLCTTRSLASQVFWDRQTTAVNHFLGVPLAKRVKLRVRSYEYDEDESVEVDVMQANSIIGSGLVIDLGRGVGKHTAAPLRPTPEVAEKIVVLPSYAPETRFFIKDMVAGKRKRIPPVILPDKYLGNPKTVKHDAAWLDYFGDLAIPGADPIE